MTPDADRLWAKSVRALQKLKGQQSIAREEVEELLRTTEEFPASDEEITALTRRVAAGKSLPLDYQPDMSWLGNEEVAGLESDLRILNRNVGETDVETKGLLSDLRAKLLGEESGDEHSAGDSSPT